MAGWMYLILTAAGAALVYNAARPARRSLARIPSWFLAFLTTDLAIVHIALAVIVSALFAWAGAFETLPGQFGLGVLTVSSLALLILWFPNLRASAVLGDVAARHGLDEIERIPRALLLAPLTLVRREVECIRNIEFRRVGGRVLKLDVYRPLAGASKRPAIVYLHGGGWVVGDKWEQGVPLCNHLATLGWVCVNANYRLSPHPLIPSTSLTPRRRSRGCGSTRTSTMSIRILSRLRWLGRRPHCGNDGADAG